MILNSYANHPAGWLFEYISGKTTSEPTCHRPARNIYKQSTCRKNNSDTLIAAIWAQFSLIVASAFPE